MLRKIFIILLALPLLLPAQYGRKLFFLQQYQKATVLNGTSQYWTKSSPSNLNLNGSEMITNANNTGFETNLGDWANFGNHSAVRSTVDDRTGSASMKITSLAAGDTTANFMYLPPSALGTIVAGNKYTIELWARSATATSTITINIGTQSATSGTLSTTFGTFTKAVFNFTATSGSDTLKIYANKAIDSLYVDDVSLTQAYDAIIVQRFKTSGYTSHGSIFNSTLARGNAPSFSVGSYGFYYQNTNLLQFIMCSTAGIAPTVNTSFNIANSDIVAVATIDRIGDVTVYINAISYGSTSITGLSNMTSTENLGVGADGSGGSRSMAGWVTFAQIVRYNSLPSNIASIIAQISAQKKPFSAYENGTIVAWYDWKSGGTDKSGSGNHLTPVASPPIINIKP